MDGVAVEEVVVVGVAKVIMGREGGGSVEGVDLGRYLRFW